MTRIAILFPGFSSKPVGGFKITLEYANYLASLGHQVTVIYPSVLFKPFYNPGLLTKLRIWKGFAANRDKIRLQTIRSWFPLDKRIEERFVFTLTSRFLPHADIYICTSAKTAYSLNRLRVNPKKKFYFIQGFENWMISTEDVCQSYRFDMRKIVISKWLKERVEKAGADCVMVPNGFDPQEYHLTIPVKEKDRFTVSVLYHTAPHKGLPTTFAALAIVKKRHPELNVNIFGAFPRPDGLPEWYHYYHSPSGEEHLRINNESAIYVAASNLEGWGLTIGEAMMCGQAVACTDVDGFREMAVDGRNALLSPVGDADALANNICRLIEDDELRYRIAMTGMQDIKQFSQQTSCKKFAQVLGL